MIAIKTIKFDLPIGGVSVKNLEEFREHFSLEVITLYQEGRLLKWLQLRKATQEITQLEALALHDPACPLTQAQAIGEALGVTDIGQKIILNSGSEHDGKKHELLWSFAFSAAEQQALITALQQRLADDAKDLLSLIILTQNPHLTESAEILLAGALGITADHELHSILKQNALLLALTLSAAEQQALPWLDDYAKLLLSSNISLSLGTLAEYPNLAESVQVLLAKDSKMIGVRKALAKNPNLTESVQVLLTKDSDQWVRHELAQNPNLTESVQVLLAKDSDELWVRSYLAKNPSLTESVQVLLAKDSKEDVRRWLAENPNLTESVQVLLAKDSEIDVRKALAQNPNLTESVQVLLAKDAEASVRWYLAKNLNLSESARAILAEDKDEWIRWIVSKDHFNAENDCDREKDQRFLLIKLSEVEQKALITALQQRFGDDHALALFARNPNLTESVQVLLAKDSEKSVRRNLAKNPNLTESVHVILLAKDSEKISSVCWAATTRDSGRWFS